VLFFVTRYLIPHCEAALSHAVLRVYPGTCRRRTRVDLLSRDAPRTAPRSSKRHHSAHARPNASPRKVVTRQIPVLVDPYDFRGVCDQLPVDLHRDPLVQVSFTDLMVGP